MSLLHAAWITKIVHVHKPTHHMTNICIPQAPSQGGGAGGYDKVELLRNRHMTLVAFRECFRIRQYKLSVCTVPSAKRAQFLAHISVIQYAMDKSQRRLDTMRMT